MVQEMASLATSRIIIFSHPIYAAVIEVAVDGWGRMTSRSRRHKGRIYCVICSIPYYIIISVCKRPDPHQLVHLHPVPPSSSEEHSHAAVWFLLIGPANWVEGDNDHLRISGIFNKIGVSFKGRAQTLNGRSWVNWADVSSSLCRLIFGCRLAYKWRRGARGRSGRRIDEKIWIDLSEEEESLILINIQRSFLSLYFNTFKEPLEQLTRSTAMLSFVCCCWRVGLAQERRHFCLESSVAPFLLLLLEKVRRRMVLMMMMMKMVVYSFSNLEQISIHLTGEEFSPSVPQ